MQLKVVGGLLGINHTEKQEEEEKKHQMRQEYKW